MALKLHDQAQNDIPVTTPGDWPDLNVQDFQAAKAIEDKVDPNHIKNLMGIAAGEVIDNFDETLVVFPLENVDLTLFEYAVYEQTYARLLGDLPVNRQHDSDLGDTESLKSRITFHESKSMMFQGRITGFSPVKHKFGSFLV